MAADRIRRAVVALALALLLAATFAGAAWAANIQCPNVPDEPQGCRDTSGNDVLYGTPGKDEIATFNGDDTVYAYKGADFLEGDKGDDIYYAGRGDDYLAADCDLDSYCGEDEKHGGPGNDHIVGNLRSEHHFGGRGDDLLVDPDSGRYPDVIRCGPGRDEVIYNKGLDKVADDCEILKPYPKRWWML